MKMSSLEKLERGAHVQDNNSNRQAVNIESKFEALKCKKKLEGAGRPADCKPYDGILVARFW